VHEKIYDIDDNMQGDSKKMEKFENYVKQIDGRVDELLIYKQEYLRLTNGKPIIFTKK
jgi:hypothetical protein